MPYFERMLELREVARRAVSPTCYASIPCTSRSSSRRRAVPSCSGTRLSGEDEVITTDQEHFGLTGPLYATGARVVIVEADEDAILGAVTPRTRLIAIAYCGRPVSVSDVDP